MTKPSGPGALFGVDVRVASRTSSAVMDPISMGGGVSTTCLTVCKCNCKIDIARYCKILQDIASAAISAMRISMQSQVLHRASPSISKAAPARRRTTVQRDIERHSKRGKQWRLCALFEGSSNLSKWNQMKLGEGHVQSVVHCDSSFPRFDRSQPDHLLANESPEFA